QLASSVPVFELSARRGDGMNNWFDWLGQQIEAQIERIKKGQSLKPAIQPDGIQLHTHDAQSRLDPQV
ncbi:MAG: hydrogenase accessory protein HypB, partial [Gammaproteobacteria bacterium]|nr:hydrogenase accessory protein HypB [Gammaproteobacteria bacterium]